MEKIRMFAARHKYALVSLYVPFYILWFSALEKRTGVEYNIMHCVVDDWIPFCEYFIVPYLLWFLYVAVVVIFLLLQTKYQEDFFRCVTALIMGMTVFLLICTIFPNAQTMRPEGFLNDNIFTRLVTALYQADTSTNVFPSIHVYNSLAVHTALCRSQALRNKNGWKTASLGMCVMICISTMTLKQHSFLDFIGACALYLLVDKVVYNTETDFSLFRVRKEYKG